MKTTVEISDALLLAARQQSNAEGTTLRALIEDGLRSVLGRRTKVARFVLPDATVSGDGLQEASRGASWEELKAMAYGDRL